MNNRLLDLDVTTNYSCVATVFVQVHVKNIKILMHIINTQNVAIYSISLLHKLCVL